MQMIGRTSGMQDHSLLEESPAIEGKTDEVSRATTFSDDPVNHPAHYGGEDNPYEAIKVIEAWGLGFALGNCVKYISRAGRKDTATTTEDLKKAQWYLARTIERLEEGK